MTTLETISREPLTKLRKEAASCTRCPLYKNATQTVFGEGPSRAPVILVGEQPGDQEDIAGKPFVGPAGRILDRALADAGVDRKRVYVTNAVKHFKFEQRGKRRLHKRPNANEIDACRWWMEHEIATLAPKLIVALGATAATALACRSVTVTKLRGQVVDFDGHPGLVTVHPSYLLRIIDRDEAAREYDRFVADLDKIAALVTEVRLAA
jgi:uracil-DNA glycosylase family protein